MDMEPRQSRNARLALLASGNGTNAEELVTYFRNHPRIAVAGILTNNPQAYVLKRAERLQVPALIFTRNQFYAGSEVLEWLHRQEVTHLVLAGFLWLVPMPVIAAFPSRIINIHPALLPRYGGKGMYGMKVHEAVKAAGDTETGITVHLVNEHYDEGDILFQARCAVHPQDTPAMIAANVHRLEHMHFPPVVERWVLGTIS